MPSKSVKKMSLSDEFPPEVNLRDATALTNSRKVVHVTVRFSKTKGYMEDEKEGSASYGVLFSDENSRKASIFNEEEKLASIEDFIDESGSSETKTASTNRIDSNIAPPTCPECRKTFPSNKSLYGHLRSHPNRGYKGAKPPPKFLKRKANLITLADVQPSFSISHWAVKSKRSPRESETPESEARDEGEIVESSEARESETTEAEYTAIQVLLSFTTSTPTCLELEQKDAKKKKIRKISAETKSYQCNACDKSFPTHQALGGHMAGHHKKHGHDLGIEAVEVTERNGGPVQVEHRCKECEQTFHTGQALGGHMRAHFDKNAKVALQLQAKENARVLLPLVEENNAPLPLVEENAGAGPLLALVPIGDENAEAGPPVAVPLGEENAVAGPELAAPVEAVNAGAGYRAFTVFDLNIEYVPA